jgi:predicted membrane chloride channel (bestrophin family)
MNSSFSFADAVPRRGLRKPETRKNRTILYDSHRWRTLCKIEGSVLPKACIYALIPALVAFALKYSEDREYIELPKLISTSAAFGGFSWTVSFLLVFRTSQCYSRVW